MFIFHLSSKNLEYGNRESFQQFTIIHVGQNDDRCSEGTSSPEGISEEFMENVVRSWILIRERTLNGKNEIITTWGWGGAEKGE